MIKENKRKHGLSLKKCESNTHTATGGFKKGHKLATGRPLGSKNKTTIILEQIGLESAQEVYKHWIDLALGRTKEGDGVACKNILDRVSPVRKGRCVALEFKDYPIKTIQDANKLSEHVTTMIITGEISAEEAEDYGKWIDRRMKSIIDSDVMDKMNSTMEKVNKVGK